MSRRFGDQTVATRPILHWGEPGGAASLEGHIDLLTSTVQAWQKVLCSLFAGPDFFSGNMAIMETNRPGRPIAGSRIGQKFYGNPRDGVLDKPALEVVSIVDSAGGPVRAQGDGIMAIRRELRGCDDKRPLVLMENDVGGGGQGQTVGDVMSTSSRKFHVTNEEQAQAQSLKALETVRSPSVTVTPFPCSSWKPGGPCATDLQATTGGMNVQPYDDSGTAIPESFSFSKQGFLFMENGAAQAFNSPNGEEFASLVMTDSDIFGVGIGAAKVSIPNRFDPLTMELTDRNGAGSLIPLGAAGFTRDDTLDALRPRWTDDTGTETSLALLTDVGGGGDHIVSDAGTNNAPVAITIEHNTSAAVPTAGFGVTQNWDLERSGNIIQTAAQIVATWRDNFYNEGKLALWARNGAAGSLAEVFSVHGRDSGGDPTYLARFHHPAVYEPDASGFGFGNLQTNEAVLWNSFSGNQIAYANQNRGQVIHSPVGSPAVRSVEIGTDSAVPALLQNFTLNANWLGRNADTVRIMAQGRFGTGSGSRTARLVFGGLSIGIVSDSSGAARFWKIEAYVTRTGAAAQAFTTTEKVFVNGGAPTITERQGTLAVNTAAAITINTNGNRGTTAAVDVWSTVLSIEKWNSGF